MDVCPILEYHARMNLNKEVLLIELGEATGHLHDLLMKISRDKLNSQEELKIDLRHVLTHIYRGYNYKNATMKDWLKEPSEESYKIKCQPPSDLTM